MGSPYFSGVLYATIISDVYECPLQDQFSAEDSEKDVFSNTLPESKLDKVSKAFDQLKEQNISLEEVANDIDVKEMLSRISQYKENFQKQELRSYGFSIYAWLKSFACLSKQREQEILIFTYKVSWKRCRIFLPLAIIYMLD